MTVQQMRNKIISVYEGMAWRRRVENMPDDQVIAIYYRFLEDGKFNQPKKKKAIESEYDPGIQLTFDFYM